MAPGREPGGLVGTIWTSKRWIKPKLLNGLDARHSLGFHLVNYLPRKCRIAVVE
jgi:hypothetical protein